jgi:hypothetical protein
MVKVPPPDPKLLSLDPSLFPYPCYDDVWQTAQNWIYPEYRAINLPMSSLYGLAKLAQQLVCAAGVRRPAVGLAASRRTPRGG